MAVLRLKMTPVMGQVGCWAQGSDFLVQGDLAEGAGTTAGRVLPHPRSVRGWLDAQQFPGPSSVDTGEAGAGWSRWCTQMGVLSGRSRGRKRQAPDLPVLPQLGAGFSDEELEQHHQSLQVSSVASAACSVCAGPRPPPSGGLVWTEQRRVDPALEPGSSSCSAVH